MELLTNEASRTSDPMSWPDSHSAITSPASAVGAWRYVLPDGRTVDEFGLARALASLSARQVKALGLQTSGICGPRGSTSSHSAGLQSSLGSRLQARLRTLGSTLYTLTWKAWTTPSGVSRSRLRGSAPRISATGCTGWVAQRDGKDRIDQLPRQAYLAGWPTPQARD